MPMIEDMEDDPNPRGTMPPPLPKRRSAWRFVLLFAGGALAFAAIVATAWFLYSGLGTQVVELNDDQRASLHQAADLQEWYEFEVDDTASFSAPARAGGFTC